MAGFANKKTTSDNYHTCDSYYKNLIRATEAGQNENSMRIFRTPPYYAKFIPGYKNPYENR